jgi:hypothetical protein
MNMPNSMREKMTSEPLNFHLERMYPLIEPIKAERMEAV